MKHFTTKFLAVCVLVAMASGMHAQVFYTQLFDGPGLPSGWTTTDPSGNNVLWERCTNVTTDCHADLGYDAFAGTDKANGFMVLDSDGAAQLATPHQSRLTSAAIDCSTKSEVYAIFEHQIGVFDYDADENARLFVSNDGTTWTPYTLFSGLTGENFETRFSDNPTVSGINISDVAANQATVYLRWEWIGNYEYWWTLDNVQLTTIDPSPANDLAVSDFFYPVSSYATPVKQIGADTFAFEAYISNLGTATQTNVKLYAYVLAYDDQGQLLGLAHIDSTVVPALAPGVVDSTFSIGELFAPELPVGLYAVAYEVVADSADERTADNFVGDFFEVTDVLFAKESAPQTGSRPADGGEWAVGNYYRMGPNLDIFKALGAEFTFAVNDPTLPGDIDVDISLYKLGDDIEEDFTGFEVDGSNLELIGNVFYDAPDDMENYDLQTAILNSLITGEEGVILEPNGRYILAAGYLGNSAEAFHAFNSDISAPFVSTVTYIGGTWGLGGFVGNPNAVLRMYLELETSADNTPLVETALSVSPNPTSDFVNLTVKFDKPTDATITIADINGRVIRTENRAGMLDQTVTYPLSGMASGTYLARIATLEGTRTLKFVVQN